MRVTFTLPMCGAAPPAAAVADVLEDVDLALLIAESRSSDEERRLCTISDDVSAYIDVIIHIIAAV